MAGTEFPTPRPGPSWARLRVRFVCSVLAAVVQLLVFREFVLGALPFLWPPREPTTQWASFIMVSLGSFVVLSGLVGTLVGDYLYDRYGLFAED